MGLGVVGPGGRFVVAGAGFEAAVEDADESVAELTEGWVVAGLTGALLVVVAEGVVLEASDRARVVAAPPRGLYDWYPVGARWWTGVRAPGAGG